MSLLFALRYLALQTDVVDGAKPHPPRRPTMPFSANDVHAMSLMENAD